MQVKIWFHPLFMHCSPGWDSRGCRCFSVQPLSPKWAPKQVIPVSSSDQELGDPVIVAILEGIQTTTTTPAATVVQVRKNEVWAYTLLFNWAKEWADNLCDANPVKVVIVICPLMSFSNWNHSMFQYIWQMDSNSSCILDTEQWLTKSCLWSLTQILLLFGVQLNSFSSLLLQTN